MGAIEPPKHPVPTEGTRAAAGPEGVDPMKERRREVEQAGEELPDDPREVAKDQEQARERRNQKKP
jgi:hypothetical protein